MEAKVCSECGGGHYAKGLCRTHYGIKRYYAIKGTTRQQAERYSVPRWVAAHVGHAGEECLIWPFFRDIRTGYGKMFNRGKNRAAHHVMCREAHGEPPAEKPYALHSCGNGQKGCVNPRHLRWGTTRENALDRIGHGTETCGSAVWSARLKADDVLAIKARVASGEKQASVARAYAIDPSHVSKIMSGRKWSLALADAGAELLGAPKPTNVTRLRK